MVSINSKDIELQNVNTNTLANALSNLSNFTKLSPEILASATSTLASIQNNISEDGTLDDEYNNCLGGMTLTKFMDDISKQFTEIRKGDINEKDAPEVVSMVTISAYQIFNLIYNKLHIFIKPIYSIIEKTVFNKNKDKNDTTNKHIIDRIMLNPMVKIIVINFMIDKFISCIVGIVMMVLFGYACNYLINSNNSRKNTPITENKEENVEKKEDTDKDNKDNEDKKEDD
jgi:hypothetical protein